MARKVRTLKKGIKLGSGKVVPAGTKLKFGTEGKAYFAGEEVDETLIPEEAIENDDVLSADFAEAQESIDALCDKAVEDGDEEALATLADIAKDTAEAMDALLNDESTDKKAVEDGFGDMDKEELATLKDAVDEVVEKLDAAKESGETADIEDAVEQFRSIIKK